MSLGAADLSAPGGRLREGAFGDIRIPACPCLWDADLLSAALPRHGGSVSLRVYFPSETRHAELS